MNKRARILVFGRVQGVGFRWAGERQAKSLNLVGCIRNTEDGAVECVAEGEQDALEHFVSWCKKGSSFARVTHCDVQWGNATGEYSSFSIVS